MKLIWIRLVGMNEKKTKGEEGARNGKRRWVDSMVKRERLVVNVIVGEKGTCWLN